MENLFREIHTLFNTLIEIFPQYKLILLSYKAELSLIDDPYVLKTMVINELAKYNMNPSILYTEDIEKFILSHSTEYDLHVDNLETKKNILNQIRKILHTLN